MLLMRSLEIANSSQFTLVPGCEVARQMMISLLLIVGPCDQSFGFEDRVAGPSPAMTAVSVRPLPEVLHAGGRWRGSAGEHLNGAFENLWASLVA